MGKNLSKKIYTRNVSKIDATVCCLLYAIAIAAVSILSFAFVVRIVIIIISIQLSPSLLFIYISSDTKEHIYSSFRLYIFIAICFYMRHSNRCQLAIKKPLEER